MPIAKFIRQAISGEPLKIYGDGSQTRDFLYIDDLVEAVIRAAMAPGIGGEVFQIATGTETDDFGSSGASNADSTGPVDVSHANDKSRTVNAIRRCQTKLLRRIKGPSDSRLAGGVETFRRTEKYSGMVFEQMLRGKRFVPQKVALLIHPILSPYKVAGT